MADDKSQDGGEGEKKQVKFSENSKETTYDKNQDDTQATEDEEVSQMRRSAHSRGSNRSMTSRTSSGEYITGDMDTEPETTGLGKETSTSAKTETDNEKFERMDKTNGANEVIDAKDTLVIDKQENETDTKDDKSVSSSTTNKGNKQDKGNSTDNVKQDNVSSTDNVKQDNVSSTDNIKQDNETSQTINNEKQDHKGSPIGLRHETKTPVDLRQESKNSIDSTEQGNESLIEKDQKYNESSNEIEIKNDDSKSDNAKETSDTDSKKEVKYALPETHSYSLNSRQRQSISSYGSPTNTSLQTTQNLNEPPPATPRDIDLTAGLDTDRKVTAEAKNTDESKPTDSNDQQRTAGTIEPEDTTVEEQKAPSDGSSEITREIKSDSNDRNDTGNKDDTSQTQIKQTENQSDVQRQPSAKQHVRLDLSSINGDNKGRTSAKSNGKPESHLKTDFRRARPAQTTATKVTTYNAKSSTNGSSTDRGYASKSAGVTRNMTPREIAASDRAEKQRTAQSAGPGGRGNDTTRSASSRASSSRPPSRPRSCGTVSERGRMKEFFQSELRRLKSSLGNEAKKFKKKNPRDFYPDVYTSLVPYCNTYEANFLINMPTYGYKGKHASEGSKSPDKKEAEEETEEESELKFTTRSTAIRLCDPWDSLNMDRNVLPKLETAELRHRRMEQLRASPKPKSPRTKRPEAKQGSTRLPKFPVIPVPNQDLTTKELYYGDIPMIRDELVRNYSHNGDERKKSDYNRTKQDFFRMELDRINEYDKSSRPHMRAAYFAYLQNTPGSRKALTDCMKEIKQKKEPQTPQAVA